MNVKNELQRLKDANLPRLNWRDVLSVKGADPLPVGDELALQGYFSRFVKPGPCICCGAQQGAKDILDGLLNARFTWGIAHGEGFCSNCTWPARAYHFDVGPIKRFEMILQYHPDELNVRQKEAA